MFEQLQMKKSSPSPRAGAHKFKVLSADMIMDENCSGELDMNTDEILKNFDPPYPASNILASQNLVLKLNLQHERKIRINIENQSRYLNDKLSEATLGLKEAKEKLLAIQKTTKDMIVTRDNREELLQKLFAMNKMYEEKYGRIQVNEIDIDLNNSFQALLQHKEMEVRLKDVKIRELEERNSYLLREFEEISSAAEEQRILNFKIHKEALEKAKNLEGEVEYLRSEIQRLLSEQQSRDSERQREELERQKQRDEEIARNLKIEEERVRKRQFDEALALAIKDETEKHLRVAMAIREEVEQRLQTFKESGSVRDERLRLLELSQASIPTLLSAELKALDDKIVQKMSADLSSLSESLQTTVLRNCNLAVAALREQVIKKFEHFDERDRQREAWQLSTALVSEIVNDAYEAAEKSIIAAKRQSLIGMETSQKILQEPSSSAWPSPFISRESSRPSSHHKDAEGDGLPTDDVISTPVASEAKTPQPSRPNSAPLVAPLPDVVDIEAVEAARAFEQAKAAEAETARIVEQLNDEIAQHAQEAKKAKQEVRRFVQQFITKNNRKPSKGERKMFAKDIFKTYHAALKEKRDKESKLQKLRNPVAADGSIGISSQMSSMTKASDSSESDA